MPQSKRLGKLLNSLVSVAAFGTRSRQNLAASVLLFSAVASVPTVAHALDVKISVITGGTETVLVQTSVVATPGPADLICSAVPCTGVNGKLVTVPIPTGTYSIGTTPVLSVLAGAKGEAKVETNATTINGSATINNILNVVGTFRMLVAGELKIVTSSDFNLRQGTTGQPLNLASGGTWQSLGKGASKCEVTSTSLGKYVNSGCPISDSSVDGSANANATSDCTICRSYGFTDSGLVLKQDPQTSAWTLPAGGVTVTMTSDVTFKNAAGAVVRTEPIGAPIVLPIPQPSGLPTDGKFVGSLSQNELVPCEPYGEPCANSERKSFTLRFTGMAAQTQVNLPATSTDLANTDFGVTQGQLAKIEIPIDIQPLDVVPDPNNPGFFLPGPNNDAGQGNSQGFLQVVALSTPDVDMCAFVPFRDGTELARLSVAGSDSVPFTEASQYSVQGQCVGLKFTFDRGQINSTVDGETDAEKLQTCFAHPIATLLIDEGATVQTTYPVAPGGNRATGYVPGPECTTAGTNVTCTMKVQVSGSQFVNCATPAGGK